MDALCPGNARCGETTGAVTITELDATWTSSELHFTEPSAVSSATDKASSVPIDVESLDNVTSGTDTVDVPTEPANTTSSTLPDSSVGTESIPERNVPQTVESGSVSDSTLKQSVLQECITRTLHK